jgi:MscS family membrane protein
MPAFLTETYYGNTLSDWLIALLLVLGSVLAGRAVYWLFSNWIKFIARRTRSRVDDVMADIIEEPLVFLVILLGVRLSLLRLALPEAAADWLGKGFSMAAALGVAWLVVRLYQTFHVGYLVPMARRSATTFDDQLLPTLRSGLTIIVWLLGVLVGLNNSGVDVGALLAGLGIGGLAFALAAQDTVANFFGGVTIFLQRPFKIGDLIEFNGKQMVVKEIGLRATKLEDFDTNYLVTIPNSQFTNGVIANVSAEPGHWVTRTLRLAPDLSAAQMEQALRVIKSALGRHPGIDKVLLRFNSFDNYAHEVLVVYHIVSFGDRWRVMSEAHLSLLRAFEQTGLRFAMPLMMVEQRSRVAMDGQRLSDSTMRDVTSANHNP